ncbi:ribonuclease H-like domain-containing protein [Tanacetum coccineum]
MSVHYYENIDDDVADSVTLISKLDINNPLHLHPNDTTALTKERIRLVLLMVLVKDLIQVRFLVNSEISSILSREVFLDVRSAYATISSKESYRVAVGSVAGSSRRNQASAFVSNVPNSQNFQRSNQNFSIGPSRHNNLNNNRQGGGSGLVCEKCGFNGHTIDRCFKIIRYPADFGKKKYGQKFKKQNVSNNNFVGKSSSSVFTDEQMATPISLIKDNKVGENVQANMAGEDQHMNYTDKELDNVLDISHLKIKVGHSNGTEAYISKIGNLRLSNGLTLYDVMVIPEYYVTLISVHKLVKENKVIVPFDENRCYFLNQNLNLKNILGIDEQCDGLYYYNEKEFEVEKNDSANVFQDVNHINFFDIEYPEIPNDDERVANDLNKDKRDSSSSSVSGSNINTANFPVDSGNDADSNDGSSGEIDRYKARLVSQGFGQNEGIDYEEKFSPVVKMATVRCLEVVYMKPPEGYFPSDNKLDISKIEKFKVYLKSKFMIKDLGKLKYFLGIEVVDTDKGMCLNQRKYVLDLLSKYGMLAYKLAKTPLMSKLVISNEASGKDPLLENITDYQKLMGKLIYLTNTRPYIFYVVHCLSQFMYSPLTSHLKIVFKILRYLKSCPGLGVHITKTSGMFLNAYSDADWAKCIVIRKSITGEKILKGVAKNVKVDSANQIADILTKGLDTIQHFELVKRLAKLLLQDINMHARKIMQESEEFHEEYIALSMKDTN